MHTRYLQSIVAGCCLFLSIAAQAQTGAPGQSPNGDPVATTLAMNVPDSPSTLLRSGVANELVPATPAPAAIKPSVTTTAAIAVVSHPAPVAAQVSQNETRTWRGLVIASHSAAFFDAWSTNHAISEGRGYERNPLMKPFAGNGSMYAMTQVAPTGLDFLSHHMLHSNNRFMRTMWWVPQTAFTAGSIWVGTRNVHVANSGH